MGSSDFDFSAWKVLLRVERDESFVAFRLQCTMYELQHYCSSDGDDLFGRWLDEVRDTHARARIAARLIRLHDGNFGECRSVGSGVWELKIDWGPGYRVYYAIDGKRVVLLLEGGDKRTQPQDIARAIERWDDWQQRSRQ